MAPARILSARHFLHEEAQGLVLSPGWRRQHLENVVSVDGALVAGCARSHMAVMVSNVKCAADPKIAMKSLCPSAFLETTETDQLGDASLIEHKLRRKNLRSEHHFR
jgi:hypothetical protein